MGRDEEKKFRLIVNDALDSGYEADVRQALRNLFGMPIEARRWFARCLVEEHPIPWDWDGVSD